HAQEEYKKTQVNNQAAQLANAIAANTASYAKPSQQMIADELQKLFDLLQRGAITQGEYDSQKGKLLGNS
ncbi:MAG: SHOCT domain-containing protein, partial [Ferruginibacter sp.]